MMKIEMKIGNFWKTQNRFVRGTPKMGGSGILNFVGARSE
jgi:hypothetical protein